MPYYEIIRGRASKSVKNLSTKMKDACIALVLRIAYTIVGANWFATWSILLTRVANKFAPAMGYIVKDVKTMIFDYMILCLLDG